MLKTTHSYDVPDNSRSIPFFAPDEKNTFSREIKAKWKDTPKCKCALKDKSVLVTIQGISETTKSTDFVNTSQQHFNFAWGSGVTPGIHGFAPHVRDVLTTKSKLRVRLSVRGKECFVREYSLTKVSGRLKDHSGSKANPKMKLW